MKIETLYRYFLITPATHLPVVDESGDLIGLLSRKLIQMEMADLSSSEQEYTRLPKNFLETEIPESFFQYFQRQKSIPVLTLTGEKKEEWDKVQVMAGLGKLISENRSSPEPVTEPKKQEQEQSSRFWFMELILQNLPDGLLATDLEGNSVFYNETFEQSILPKKYFRDSILQAERLLKEMSKNLLADYLKSNELRLDGNTPFSLQTYITEIECNVRIIVLKQNSKIAGYLYHFITPRAVLGRQNESGLEFPSVSDAFFQKLPLETMLKEVESAFIFHSLKANQDNISHTALQLGIPRTTLQNRIKFLDLQSRYTLSRENSIPRKKAVPPHHSEEKPETHTKNPKSSASSKQVPVTSKKSGKSTSKDNVRTKKKSTSKTASLKQTAKKRKFR
ncbi:MULTISPECIES: CBS domain-containing protein [Leptospira]|uniref:Transcriptional regulator, Fis family n=3 Tax=Leptospira borgpetersenii TaxID=174 RepID=M3HR79_LEPBO|nr:MULTISPECIES: CBS domain-containing protein [Leptospira]EMG00546.1 transcriptional regulator, Fis family [Leptospira borgpetersenii str. 200701203]EKP14511.1 transcriptional regulator, Fis family [Leptospira borgpetersenii str. 200801926]EMK12400.1 transcriptional regulator, Fis family [Leptospira sp. serovar Kenya str. Sh9]EMN13400.1 transcriptional regulator, Fis family [Leptospira borgpetersenii str. Brem 307]EMN19173.1 transcriptional regulator, Fis family [Leptospira borgpetersenii str